MPGRAWTVDNHPDRDKIVAAVIEGRSSLRTIARQYDIDPACVSRYLSDRLAPAAAAVQAERGKAEGEAVLARLEAIMAKMDKLLTACDEYLQDPDNPERYELGPRSWEIDIVYRTVEGDTDKMINRKESLQTLLEKIDAEGYQPWEVRFKQADPRKLIVDTATALTRQLEVMAKIQGAIKDTVINVNLNQYWARMKAIIIQATQDSPEVRDAIIRQIADEGGE